MSSPFSRFRIAALAALAVGNGTAAMARGPGPFIPTAGEVDAPRGFVEMCRRDASLCQAMAPGVALATSPRWENIATGAIGADRARIGLGDGIGPHPDGASQAELRLLRSVNRRVNGDVVQQTDMQMFGRAEYWRPSGVGAGARGDCEDLAIEKRLALIKAGFPAERMSFAVVYRSELGLHTVLIAHTGAGDYVLDSRNSFVELWNKPPYSWISLQAPGDGMTWRRVQPRLG